MPPQIIMLSSSQIKCHLNFPGLALPLPLPQDKWPLAQSQSFAVPVLPLALLQPSLITPQPPFHNTQHGGLPPPPFNSEHGAGRIQQPRSPVLSCTAQLRRITDSEPVPFSSWLLHQPMAYRAFQNWAELQLNVWPCSKETPG